MNKTYRVYISDYLWSFVDVKANDEDEARELVKMILASDCSAHVVKYEESGKYDNNDVIKIDL